MSVEASGYREYRVFDGIGNDGPLRLIAPDQNAVYDVTGYEDTGLRRALSAANTGSTVTLRLERSSADDGYQARRPPSGLSLTLNPPHRLQDRAGEWRSPAASTTT